MLELRVYYHDVLRYTVIGDWLKVLELQSQGYSVGVKLAIRRGLRENGSSDHSPDDDEKYHRVFIS